MKEEDKTSRRQRKGVVTRYINTLQQHIADEDVDALADQLEVLKDAIKNFQFAHDKYHTELQTEDDEQASENTFSMFKILTLMQSKPLWVG